jgi:hypothetical protein
MKFKHNFQTILGVPAKQTPFSKQIFVRRQAIRYKSSLHSGLFAAILHAKKESRNKNS